jgi:hypothetical protein
MTSMSKAFVFLNCDIGAEPEIIDQMNKISGVHEAVRVSGVYDIVAKISEESKESIVKLVKKIRGISSIRSSLTMIVAEDSPVAMAA